VNYAHSTDFTNMCHMRPFMQPANVLIDDDGSAVLADFGLAQPLRQSALNYSATTVGGTSYFM
jgi:serine/threonine protein kinase